MRKPTKKAGASRFGAALLIVAAILAVVPALAAQDLQTAGQVVSHRNSAVLYSGTAWIAIPGGKSAVTLPTGGDLSIQFTGEGSMTGQSSATCFFRVLVDGKVVSPVVRKLFVGPIGLRTATVSYLAKGLAAGPHRVKCEYATTSGDKVWLYGRTLVLRFATPDSPHIRMSGVEGTSASRKGGGYADMLGLATTIDCPWDARVSVQVSGEFWAYAAQKRIFVRAVIDGSTVALPSDTVVHTALPDGCTSFTFHVPTVKRGKHAVKLQWMTDDNATVLFPTMTVLALPVATNGMSGQLFQAAPSGPEKSTGSMAYSPIPDLGGKLFVPCRSDLEIRLGTEVQTRGTAKVYLSATVDGKPANDASYVTCENATMRIAGNECAFVVRDVERGWHDVRVLWAVTGGGTAYVGDRALSVIAVQGQRPLLVTAMESTRPTGYTYGGQFASSVVEVKNLQRVFRSYVADMFYRANPGVADWFRENSRGQMRVVEAAVIGPNLKKYNEKYYRENVKDPFTQMKLEALQSADKQFDYSYYDRDGDGKVERDELWALVVFYQDTNFGEVRTLPTLVTGDGVTLDYSGGIATVYTPDFKTSNQIGVTNHELCHLFLRAGDMYENGDPTAPGPYSIMDQHGWNAHLDPMHKLITGKWEDPHVVSGDGYRTLPGISRGGVIMKLHDPTSHKGEYWLVENRADHGYNASLPAHGLAIFHCDESRLPNWRTAVEIEPCGGKNYKYADYLFRGVKAGFDPENDFWNASPLRDARWHDGKPSNIGVWGVRQVNEHGDMRAYYDLPGPGILVENEFTVIKAVFAKTAIHIRLVNTHTAKDTFLVKVTANSKTSWTSRYETLNGYQQRVIVVDVDPVQVGFLGTVTVTAQSTTHSSVKCEDRTDILYTLRAGSKACPGCVVSLYIHDPVWAGKNYEMRASLGSEPGFSIPGVGVVPLLADDLFFATPLISNFQKFRGTLNAKGEERALVVIPNDARLKGVSLYCAYVAYDTKLRAISNAVHLHIQ